MKKGMLRNLVILSTIMVVTHIPAAEVILPQGRTAYYVDETVEIAIAGVELGQESVLSLIPPADAAIQPVSITITGDGTTQLLRLPPLSLAPASYSVQLDGQPVTGVLGNRAPLTLTLSRGVNISTMHTSQTGAKPLDAGANFTVSNAFSFGLFDPHGQPSTSVRGMSTPMQHYNTGIAEDIPSVIYMYWTGYVLHKPWGTKKPWRSPDMIESMRLFNFHVAQRLRRWGTRQIKDLGPLDEPGLNWGATPAGGSATGYPNWNEKEWYEERGWSYTQDPASGTDEEWLKYVDIRADMIYEAYAEASRDIKTVWPEAHFAGDLYAPHAVLDGTDPWNQRANDTPTTHVFADFGIGKIGVLGGLMLEKAHDPTAKVAHAMNGQLFGGRFPHPKPLYGYFMMQNALLAGGITSNWWLNNNSLTVGEDDAGNKGKDLLHANLKRLHEPAQRVGPLFQEVDQSAHDVALLWSFTEIVMRVKEITAREANRKTNDPIKLMIADMPEDILDDDGNLQVQNAYSIGSNYRTEILHTHTALGRAGYPAHIVHEYLLEQGALDAYKVLVIAGQTFELPKPAMDAVRSFIANGGKVVVDHATSIDFPGAIRFESKVPFWGFRWSRNWDKLRQLPETSEERRDLTYEQTSLWMETPSRETAPTLAPAMLQTAAQRIMMTGTVELSTERHVGGEGQLIMLLNGYQELPEIAPTEAYPLWNYAPYQATVRLLTVQPTDVVYQIAGQSWDRIGRLENPTGELVLDFDPAEMKLFLVAPREPQGLTAGLTTVPGAIDATVQLNGVAMPWPLRLTISGPDGQPIISIYRAVDAQGQYSERIPLGLNAPAGAYTLQVEALAGGFTATAQATMAALPVAPEPVLDVVRVFDAKAIADFLATKPSLTIAYAQAEEEQLARRMANALTDMGLPTRAAPQADIWRKGLYPRVWDPHMQVFSPTTEEQALPQMRQLDEQGKPVRDDKNQFVMEPGSVRQDLRITSDYYGHPTVTTLEGEPFTKDWQLPGTRLEVVGNGLIDTWHGVERFIEPGVKLYVLDNKRFHLINASMEDQQTDAAFRQKWSRPWSRLIRHVGAFNLTPKLPEAYLCDEHLILLGDSEGSELVRALQASELLPQVVDKAYPGPGKALLQFAWSPFGLEKNVIYVGAVDAEGLRAGLAELMKLTRGEQ